MCFVSVPAYRSEFSCKQLLPNLAGLSRSGAGLSRAAATLNPRVNTGFKPRFTSPSIEELASS